jgi:hypothetical protein
MSASPPPPPSPTAPAPHPVTFAVDYPDRDLNRVSTALRIFAAIPIAIVLAAVGGGPGGQWGHNGSEVAIGAGGWLVLAPLLMIVFRRRYPGWWFDWNLQLLRFGNRVGVYIALMDDRYPSTTDAQSVHLELPRPVDPDTNLHQWLPLVKWFLAIPHYVVLFFLTIGAIFAVIGAWVAILFTGRYPRGLFDFVEGVVRWHMRVVGYAFVLVTDEYPPFRLAA